MKVWAQKQKGFTIVELLIVIVVIGILAAITIVAYNGIQQRTRLSSAQAAASQAQKSLEVARVETDGYPARIDDCPNPASGNTCTQPPSGFTANYIRVAQGSRPTPMGAGTTLQAGYELSLRSDSSVVYSSNFERRGVNEFLQYMDMAPLIDHHGLRPYTISFDIRSADTSLRNTVNVYMQNGSGAKYTFGVDVPVTTSYARQSITVTPRLSSSSDAYSVLAFYGHYNTGNIPHVKNVEIMSVR